MIVDNKNISFKFFSKHLLLIVLVALLLNVPLHLFAQQKSKLADMNLMVQLRLGYGFLLQHHPELRYFDSHIPSLDVSLVRHTYGHKKWETLYDYPEIGLMYYYSPLSQVEGLGSAHALLSFINFPLHKFHKSELTLRVGLGLVYLTKCFDRLNNYKHIAIGSHVNSAESFLLEYKYIMSNNIQFMVGAQIIHFSNGSMKTPNFGINIPSINSGLSVRINKEKPKLFHLPHPDLIMYEFDGKRFFEVKFGTTFGNKELTEFNGKRYNVFATFASISTSLNEKNKIGLSFDLSYDSSDEYQLNRKGIFCENYIDVAKTGVSVAHELVLNRLSFAFNLGFYTSGKLGEGASYYKIGLHYKLGKNIFANLTLKTHFARADYVGIGIGYSFKLKHYLY